MPCRTMLCRMRCQAARRGLRGRACAALGSRARTPLRWALLDNVLQRVAALVAFAGMGKSGPGTKVSNWSLVAFATPGGPSNLHLIATLSFDNMAAIGAAFASPEGKATAADVPKFASGGVEMHFSETAEV